MLVVASAILVAACGSAATPTQAPDGGGGGGGGNPTQNAGGGGGGSKPAGWDKYGKVAYTISGPLSAGGELGFSPPGSLFAGAQVSLSFFDEPSSALLALRFDGTNLFAQYGDGKIVFASDQCTTSNLSIQVISGSGSFDCTGVAVNEAGATLQGAKMTGTFTAKAS